MLMIRIAASTVKMTRMTQSIHSAMVASVSHGMMGSVVGFWCACVSVYVCVCVRACVRVHAPVAHTPLSRTRWAPHPPPTYLHC